MEICVRGAIKIIETTPKSFSEMKRSMHEWLNANSFIRAKITKPIQSVKYTKRYKFGEDFRPLKGPVLALIADRDKIYPTLEYQSSVSNVVINGHFVRAIKIDKRNCPIKVVIIYA